MRYLVPIIAVFVLFVVNSCCWFCKCDDCTDTDRVYISLKENFTENEIDSFYIISSINTSPDTSLLTGSRFYKYRNVEFDLGTKKPFPSYKFTNPLLSKGYYFEFNGTTSKDKGKCGCSYIGNYLFAINGNEKIVKNGGYYVLER